MIRPSWQGKKKVNEYFDLEVVSFKSSYKSGVSFISENPFMSDDDLVFSNDMKLSLETTILAPHNKVGQSCAVHMYTTKPYVWKETRVSDIQLKNEDGQPQYEVRNKRQVPVIDDLVSIGSLDRNHGYEGWTALVYLPVDVTRDFQFALLNGLAPYVSLNFMRIAKTRMIKTIAYDSSEAYSDNR